ncbi:hypothetical protein GCM10029992_59530 [Glycomyces albus]
MSDLGGDAVGAAQQVVLDDHAAADAGADGVEDRGAVAAGGAELVLAPDGDVRVVLDHDRQVDGGADLVAQGLVLPGQVGGEHDRGAVGGDPSGGAYADRFDVVAFGAQFGDDLFDRLDHARGVVRRGGAAGGGEDVPVRVYQAAADLGPPMSTPIVRLTLSLQRISSVVRSASPRRCGPTSDFTARLRAVAIAWFAPLATVAPAMHGQVRDTVSP